MQKRISFIRFRRNDTMLQDCWSFIVSGPLAQGYSFRRARRCEPWNKICTGVNLIKGLLKKVIITGAYWQLELRNISLTLSSSWISVGAVFVVGKTNIFWDFISLHFFLFCSFTPFNKRINIQWGQYRGKGNKNIKLRNRYQSKKSYNKFT